MWFKHRAWIPAAWLAAALNVGAVWFAAQPPEPLHATGHALLAVLLALGARHLTERQRGTVAGAELQQVLEESEQLQRTIDRGAVPAPRIHPIPRRGRSRSLLLHGLSGPRPERDCLCGALCYTRRDDTRGSC